MNKTYISSLLVVLAATQTIRAQESLDDVFAQLDAAQGGTEQAAPATGAAPAASPAPASVETAQPAAVATAPAAVPAPEAVAASKDLFTRGMDAFKAGDLAMAEALFEEVLKKDPYDRRAMEYLKRTAQKISANEIALQRASRAQAIAAVDASWNADQKIPKLDISDSAAPKVDERELAIQAMTARLEQINIPSLDFREANIKDVVLFLTETARRQDPSQQGVNILLMGMDSSMSMGANNITISIRDMSLVEALQYIVEMASLKYEVQPKAVAIMPVNYVAPENLKLVSYNVIPEVGAELESMADGGGGGVDDLFGDASASSGSSGPTDVAGFFSIVEWPEGSSAIYQPNFHKLFVKNTPKNLEGVENILADLEDEAIKKRSQQVEIEAKFVEYQEGALEELGFNWTLYDNGTFGGMSFAEGTYYQPGQGMSSSTDLDDGSTLYSDPTTGYRQISNPNGSDYGQSLFGSNQRNNSSVFETVQSGILSAMGGAPAEMILRNSSSFPFDLAITAMEQEGTADILSAPKVTTKSGSPAVIRIVEVHRYPQDYNVETGQRTAPVVIPQDWEPYDLGVVLNVTPLVDSESNTIDLELQPEITTFQGYDSYIAGYNSYESGDDESVTLGNSAALEILMPYFETRSIETQVTIADGATIVMGGLVDESTETFRDQVPFLGDIPYIGRLFRSEGTRTAKKNLVISVKATQVDDRGMTRAERERVREAQQASVK